MTVTASQLAYLPPDDESAFLDWLGYHSQAHQQVEDRATKDGKNNLGTYNVADMADMEDWLFFHNQEHIEIAQAYNIAAPPDLGAWDRKDPINDANWLQAHSLVHDNEQKALKL